MAGDKVPIWCRLVMMAGEGDHSVWGSGSVGKSGGKSGLEVDGWMDEGSVRYH